MGQRPLGLDEAQCTSHGDLTDEIPDETDLLQDAVDELGAVTSTNQQAAVIWSGRREPCEPY